ncbi:MAG: Gfo/Idh/MocA family oxidoreductase [Armatimonadetes bacterium]|nr:Gfo/Idh/MocA family oxidoreductase [Armatimonadota bacterium]
MDKLRVAIIGTGKKKERPDQFGFAMAYRHADAYRLLDACEMVACADIVAENARAFADTCDVAHTYSDYREMLEREKPDIVSICTWPHIHEPMVLDACRAGVKAIHCEKPMSDTWGGAKRMAAAAKEAGVQLTFNHQRRYGMPFVLAKKLLDEGAVGELVRLECECRNLYDTGTHFIDMLSLFNGERPAKWVLAQIDYRTEDRVFGIHCDNNHVVLTEYENGVFGLMLYAGRDKAPVGCVSRLIGTDGVIEVGMSAEVPLRCRLAGGKEWRALDAGGGGIHGPNLINIAIADVVACLQEGRRCQLDASNALIATEIIFGAYESSRRRARVDFPLDIEDNPLMAMVASGDLRPAPGG